MYSHTPQSGILSPIFILHGTSYSLYTSSSNCPALVELSQFAEEQSLMCSALWSKPCSGHVFIRNSSCYFQAFLDYNDALSKSPALTVKSCQSLLKIHKWKLQLITWQNVHCCWTCRFILLCPWSFGKISTPKANINKWITETLYCSHLSSRGHSNIQQHLA